MGLFITEGSAIQLYPITPVFFLLLALCWMRGLDRLTLFVAAMIPFGMLAVIGLPSVGGLSLLAVNLASATLIGAGTLIFLGRLVRGQTIRVEATTITLFLFTLYAMFSATVLVRLFAGEIMVFSLSRDAAGVQVSTMFSWGKIWLRPSNSNISQTFYVMLSAGLFVVLVDQFCRKGAAFGAKCFAVAAGLNIVLGVLDLLALDPLLAFIRTANYALMNEVSVGGIPRIVGGYSEASSFGSASATFFAFFASAALRSKSGRDWTLAIGNGLFACLALSATGLVAMAVVTALLATRIPLRLPDRMSRKALMWSAIGFAALVSIIAWVIIFTELPQTIYTVVNNLILQKSQSTSGFERSAWAMGGLEAAQESYGLGVGTGSLRSNGLFFVLMGSVGIPGTLAFGVFLWLAFAGRAVSGQGDILTHTRLAALAELVSQTLSTTTPDPGVPLMMLAALAVATRRYPANAPQPAPREPLFDPALVEPAR